MSTMQPSGYYCIGKKPVVNDKMLHGVCKCGLVYEAPANSWKYWMTSPTGEALYTMECHVCQADVASIDGKYPDAERKKLVDANGKTIPFPPKAKDNKPETPESK